MSSAVCLFANAFGYTSGGHLWVYLNWALGLQSAGSEVTWLERVPAQLETAEVQAALDDLRCALEPYGLADRLSLVCEDGRTIETDMDQRLIPFEEVAQRSDLLLNMRYDTVPAILERFRRTALLDIDPGLLQIWMSEGQLDVAPHDMYFTTGETVGRPGSLCPDVGVAWNYAPPCVALDWWPITGTSGADAAYTTVSHWSGDEWVWQNGDYYINDKREGFLPFLDLPRRVEPPLELALCLAEDEEEDRERLHALGWRLKDSVAVAGTAKDYQRYIQSSLGEFSCVKPSCVKLQNAWMSDRTICYLASGKPAIVQHTGQSAFLPDCAGLARFRDLDEAVERFSNVTARYDEHVRSARALVEEHFDARKVSRSLLERALA